MRNCPRRGRKSQAKCNQVTRRTHGRQRRGCPARERLGDPHGSGYAHGDPREAVQAVSDVEDEEGEGAVNGEAVQEGGGCACKDGQDEADEVVFCFTDAAVAPRQAVEDGRNGEYAEWVRDKPAKCRCDVDEGEGFRRQVVGGFA